MPSVPSAARRSKAAWNAPGDGAAVSGRRAADAQRFQNSAVDRSTPSVNSSVAEADGERDDVDAVLFEQRLRQVARAVGDDADRCHVPPSARDCHAARAPSRPSREPRAAAPRTSRRRPRSLHASRAARPRPVDHAVAADASTVTTPVAAVAIATLPSGR